MSRLEFVFYPDTLFDEGFLVPPVSPVVNPFLWVLQGFQSLVLCRVEKVRVVCVRVPILKRKRFQMVSSLLCKPQVPSVFPLPSRCDPTDRSSIGSKTYSSTPPQPHFTPRTFVSSDYWTPFTLYVSAPREVRITLSLRGTPKALNPALLTAVLSTGTWSHLDTPGFRYLCVLCVSLSSVSGPWNLPYSPRSSSSGYYLQGVPLLWVVNPSGT